MFTLKQDGPEISDCTAPYSVTLDKEYTVSEFVEAVLTREDEWGTIGIYNREEFLGGVIGSPRCDYFNGVLKSKLPDDILSKKVKHTSAHGGWTNMDYLLWIE